MIGFKPTPNAPERERLSPEEAGVLSIVKTLGGMIAVATWLISVVYLFSGVWSKFFLALAFAVFLSGPSALIFFKKYSWAKTYFLIQFILISLALPIAVGPDARTEWVIVLAPGLAAMLFKVKRPYWFLTIGLLGYAAIMAIYHFHPALLPSTYPEFFRFALASLICLFIFWMIELFKKQAASDAETIRQQHRHLLENQEIIAQHNAELIETNQKLELQRASLQARNSELSQFASIASHDLKAPLRTISSFANLLARRIGDDPNHLELLGFIETGAKRMSLLVDDLISFARVGTENAEPEKVNLNHVVENVRSNLNLHLEQSGGHIQTMHLPVLLAHGSLLTQLFQNILSNGLKYRRPEEPPLLKIRFIKKDGNLLFAFRDNGLGITKENIERIFEPFRRLHAQSEIDGSGIGLATCRKILDVYKGRMWAESEPGVGSVFYVELPGSMEVREEAVEAALK